MASPAALRLRYASAHASETLARTHIPGTAASCAM